ncbi:hypothetical protein C496_23533 [Natronorubrum tibetense GA33]|uniref:Uncharacterized protein n=1 Tax=Natronorubrum tibetense GA33 TaxID=1114856 RepID=L9VE56_9EURY|nr:hypothetical protein C496_23533 [Natronorubrum tibetense GA33]
MQISVHIWFQQKNQSLHLRLDRLRISVLLIPLVEVVTSYFMHLTYLSESGVKSILILTVQQYQKKYLDTISSGLIWIYVHAS